MSGLDNLKKRILYRGGSRQVDRMIEEKRNSLNKALLYSYQSATAVLSDGREFRCLINPNKISMELDDKMLSIPFEDICLNCEKPEGENTLEGKQTIGVAVGDTIEWKENGTHWIIYSQYLQEVAYFRGLMRQCESDPIEINGHKFWFYLKGPDEKGIDWQKTKNLIFNNLNYTVEIYISNTKETKEFFQRFKKCKINERSFEVQAVDDLSTKGILTVYLKEDYTNKWEKQESPEEKPVMPEGYVYIDGPDAIYPYDIAEYQVLNTNSGKWILSNNRARIIQSTNTTVTIEVLSGRSGEFSLIYRTGNSSANDVIKNIKILSL